MFYKKSMFLGVVVMLVLFSSVQTMAADLCSELDGKSVAIVANGASGTIVYLTKFGKQQDGTYTFETTVQFENEPVDKLVGTCKDRHIVFTRTREGGFVQKYDGWIFEGLHENRRKMAGVFSHDGATKWGWYGWLGPKAPK
jgi:hypothetical protein